MKRSFILMGIFLSLIGLSNANGQTIAPSILNATGGTKTVGSTIWDWSVGEIALVNTFYADSLIVTQGLLQNDISIPASVPNTILAQNLQVFPNPASSLVNMQYTSSQQGTLSYRLMDVAGHVIIKNSTEVNPGVTKEQISISTLAVASYMLEVSFKTNADKEETTTYKIQKLQ